MHRFVIAFIDTHTPNSKCVQFDWLYAGNVEIGNAKKKAFIIGNKLTYRYRHTHTRLYCMDKMHV